MKYLFLILVFLLSLTLSIAQSEDTLAPGINETVHVEIPEERKENIFKKVEEMPRFPGCDDLLDEKERTTCSHTKFIEYIYSNLKYPTKARKNKTEGKVFVQFVVDRDGSINDVKIVRDIGDGCGLAVKDIVTSMNKNHKWSPGKQRGKAVKVLYTLPVNFAL